MAKKILLASLAVFVAWSVLDFIMHGLILRSSYQATYDLWRPMEEMKAGLIYFTVLVSSTVFVSIYALYVAPKSIQRALTYGLLFGVAMGIGMGYGTYAVMPIPYSMALTWFLGTVVEGTVGGLLAGLIIRS